MERAPAKGRSRAMRMARPNHKRGRARTKERALERASRRKVSLPKKRERAKAKARIQPRMEKVETVLVIQARGIHTLFRALCG